MKVFRFIQRSKILHILFWVYSIVSYTHQRQEYYGGTFATQLLPTSIMKLFEIISVYFTLYVLVPRYLNRNKYVVFIGLMLLTVIICALASSYSMNVYAWIVKGPHIFDVFVVALSLMIEILVITMVFVAISIVYSRFENDQHNRKLEKERLEIELDFLKAQINPHFLLNTLNTIYYKIEKSNSEARDILMKFSDMLKYQLYDADRGMVPIEKELEYLKNYINLQQLRLNDRYEVNFSYDATMSGFEIPQQLLMPFVENAFKHISHYEDGLNKIEIHLSKQNGSLNLMVRNTTENTILPATHGGIGLVNVRRRLNLLYSKKHEIQTNHADNMYEILLQITV